MSVFWYKTTDKHQPYRLCHISGIPKDQLPGSPIMIDKGETIVKFLKGAQSWQDIEPALLKTGLLDKVKNAPENLTVEELEKIDAATFFQLGYLLNIVPTVVRDAYLVKTTIAP